MHARKSDKEVKDEREAPVTQDSMHSPKLQEHPLLQVAFMMTKQNLGGCMFSGTCHHDTDYSLLHLPLSFGLAKLPPSIYATTHAYEILLNSTLVENSTQYVGAFGHLRQASSNSRCALEDMNHLAYIAILQESLEYELGHLKHHSQAVGYANDGKADLDSSGFQQSSTKMIGHEAGYGTHQTIHEDDLNEISRSSTFKRLKLYGERNDDNLFQPPLRPRFLYVSQKAANQFEYDPFLQELVAHMNRNHCSNEKKRKRGDDANDIALYATPPNSHRSNKMERSRKQPPSSVGSHRDPWVRSIDRFLPTTTRKAREMTEAQQ